MKLKLLFTIALIATVGFAQPAFTEHLLQASNTGNHVTAGDIDNDGDIDLFSCTQGSGEIRWHKNNGAGNFDNVLVDTMLPDVPSYVYICDVDQDGLPDIVNSRKGVIIFGWYKNNGDGTFIYHSIYQAASFENYDSSLSFGDFDNDTDIDFIGARFNGLYLFTNDGNENFSMTLINNADVATPASWVRTIDLDGDGDQDFIAANNFNGFSWYENNGASAFTYHNVDIGAVLNIKRNFINYADIDSDGDIDLLGTFSSNIGHEDDKFVWYQNNGSEVFTRKIVSADFLGFSRNAYYSDTADIDNDGDVDIIGTTTLTGYNWFENDGDEIFTPHWIAVENTSATACIVADLDNDGDLDVAGSRLDETEWFESDLIVLHNQDFADSHLTVFPNPADDFLYVHSDLNGPISAQLFDMQGKLLLTGENTGRLNLTHCQAGIYFLKITAGSENKVMKILKK